MIEVGLAELLPTMAYLFLDVSHSLLAWNVPHVEPNLKVSFQTHSSGKTGPAMRHCRLCSNNAL